VSALRYPVITQRGAEPCRHHHPACRSTMLPHSCFPSPTSTWPLATCAVQSAASANADGAAAPNAWRRPLRRPIRALRGRRRRQRDARTGNKAGAERTIRVILLLRSATEALHYRIARRRGSPLSAGQFDTSWLSSLGSPVRLRVNTGVDRGTQSARVPRRARPSVTRLHARLRHKELSAENL
jgi:hypothetical protein